MHEQAYGVIVVFRGESDVFLILQHKDAEGSWSFPKGHHDGTETPRETALRELREETGISEVDIVDVPLIHEEYELAYGDEQAFKKNDYFIGFVKNTTVKIPEDEIHQYRWATYDEALKIFQYNSRREVLRQANEYLTK